MLLLLPVFRPYGTFKSLMRPTKSNHNSSLLYSGILKINYSKLNCHYTSIFFHKMKQDGNKIKRSSQQQKLQRQTILALIISSFTSLCIRNRFTSMTGNTTYSRICIIIPAGDRRKDFIIDLYSHIPHTSCNFFSTQ